MVVCSEIRVDRERIGFAYLEEIEDLRKGRNLSLIREDVRTTGLASL